MKKMRFYIVFLMMIFLVSCKQKVEKTETIRPVFYKPVAEMSVSGKRTFAGVSQAEHEAKLSFKVGGTLEKILYKLGETIPKGKTIAYLNSEDYRINYQKAEVAKKNAEIQLSSARSAFNRIEKLYANNNASLSDFEKAKAQYESAKAMLKTSESQLKAAFNQLRYTKLKAPFTGTISKILAKENEMIGAGRPVLVFSSNGKTELRTQVPENVIKKIKLGQNVKVRFTVIPDKIFNGVVSEMARSTSGASTYPVIIDLTDKYNDILPGMACTIEMNLGRGNGDNTEIIIPPDAVAHDEEGDFVYTIKRGNKKGIYFAKRRNVTLGKLTSMGYAIKKGLNTNDTIITAGLNFMYDGRKVKLLEKH